MSSLDLMISRGRFPLSILFKSCNGSFHRRNGLFDFDCNKKRRFSASSLSINFML